MKTIVVGAGYWGSKYVSELGPNCVGVVDTNLTKAQKIGQSFGVSGVDDLGGAIALLDFEAAVVATPPDSHVDIALQLLEAGKYVLVEKPLAHSANEARQLLQHRDHCMAGLIYLHHPVVQELRVAVQTNYSFTHGFSRRTNHGPIRSWGDARWDLAPHDVSIFNYILNSVPSKVIMTGRHSWAMIALEYGEVEFDVCVYVSWLGGPKKRVVEFTGSANENRIIFDDVVSSAALEISPLRRMLDAFMSKEWDDRGSVETGLAVVQTLEGELR